MRIRSAKFYRKVILHSMQWIAVGLLGSGCETPHQPTPPRREAVVELATSRPLAAYDRFLADAVKARWYDLIEGYPEPDIVAGKVVIRFKLHSDGQVSDLDVQEATVPPAFVLLCEKAIRDPAPFGKWPSEIRLAFGEDERNITFIFYYKNDTQPRARTLREALERRHAPADER